MSKDVANTHSKECAQAIANLLDDLMIEKNISQYRLAMKVGELEGIRVSPSTIGSYRTGYRVMSAPRMFAIEQALEVEPGYFAFRVARKGWLNGSSF